MQIVRDVAPAAPLALPWGAGRGRRILRLGDGRQMAARSIEDERRILEGHGLFGQLSRDELDRILAFARIETYRARQVIFRKGSPGRGLMAVLAGQVQIRSGSADGRDAILNQIEAGEVFGEMALLDGGDRSADAVAAGECRLLVIDRRDFLPFLERNPTVAIRLLAILSDKVRRATEQLEDLLFLDLASRLAKRLLRLAKPDGAGGRRRTPAVSQRELAAQVGFSRESVNKQLAEWQRKKLIALADRRVAILDEDAMTEIAGGT